MFWLGERRHDGARLELPQDALLRHVAALGGSGSGKTVFCKTIVEEAVRSGVPAICVDPQGDLCSFLLRGDPSELASHGVDPALAEAFFERADVVIWTPGSHRGVPLCTDPVDSAVVSLPMDERARAVSRMAGRVAALLGYDLSSDDGQGLMAVLDSSLEAMIGGPFSLDALANHLEAHGDRYARLWSPKKIAQANQRLARLDVGARRLLFHDGVPLDVDTMLRSEGDRTRLSVIYLNTLDHQEDKDFVVANLVERLYAWMLRNPSPTLQALFYIDEVAPFLPPVRKPACKEGLQMLFKQARKYGIGCLMATQNPGDVDYKSLAQLSTWALGRITTRQDRQKLDPAVRSLAPDDADGVLEALAGQAAGELMLLGPDWLKGPTAMRTRWLYSRHETLSEERIAECMESKRAALLGAATRASTPGAAPSSTPGSIAPAAPTSTPAAPVTPAAGIPADLAAAIEAHLSGVASASAGDIATALGVSPAAIEGVLEALPAARALGDGRWWTATSGARPDLGLGRKVFVVRGFEPSHAQHLAHERVRKKTFGVIGDDETLEGFELRYRMVYKIDFEETVRTSLLRRLTGDGAEEHRFGSLYFHPTELTMLTFSPSRGIAFIQATNEQLASDVEDLDGHAEITSAPPGELPLHEPDVLQRKSVPELQQLFQKTWDAKPTAAAMVFVPVWSFVMESRKGQVRRKVAVDGIVGHDVDWD